MIKVSVNIATYNQEAYVEKCLKSVINQKTDFNFEVIVGDDASNDKTQQIILDVCRNRKNFKLVLRKSNLGCPYNGLDILRKSKGEYIDFSKDATLGLYLNKIIK